MNIVFLEKNYESREKVKEREKVREGTRRREEERESWREREVKGREKSIMERE